MGWTTWRTLGALAVATLTVATPAIAVDVDVDVEQQDPTPPVPAMPGVIAYSRWSGLDDALGSLVTVRPDGTDFRTIVERGMYPAFSPNGRWLTYVVPDLGLGPRPVVVARADGTGERPLPPTTTADQWSSSPTWSPDGRHIASSIDGSLVVVDLPDGEPRTIEIPDACFTSQASWSPDGSRLAVISTCTSEQGAQIWTVALDGSDARQLTTHTDTEVNDLTPVWSPDGTQIAFARTRSRTQPSATWTSEIWVMAADGTNQRHVPTGGTSDGDPAWSPDGSRLVFSRWTQPRGSSLYLVRPDGSDLTRLTTPPSPVQHRLPAWQPLPVYTAAACPGGQVPDAAFVDVAGTHRDTIACVVWHELAFGVSEHGYLPDHPVRRDQMASFLARLLERAGVTLPEPAETFADVAGNEHADAIERLAAAGVVAGMTPTTYVPAGLITRAQMASLLVRAYEHVTGESLPRVFDEFADDTGSVHEHAIDQATFAGFVSGVEVSRFEPGRHVRRDQMASFLARTLDRLVRDGHATLPAR